MLPLPEIWIVGSGQRTIGGVGGAFTTSCDDSGATTFKIVVDRSMEGVAGLVSADVSGASRTLTATAVLLLSKVESDSVWTLFSVSCVTLTEHPTSERAVSRTSDFMGSPSREVEICWWSCRCPVPHCLWTNSGSARGVCEGQDGESGNVWLDGFPFR